MIRTLILCLTLALAGPAAAQDGPGAAIENTIQSQMEAFKADDFARAFTYASPGIKRIFGGPERFGAMVRQGYPMVHRPAEVTFLELDRAGDGYRQKVMVRDADGAFHTLEYSMIETDAGWQIDGVQLLEAAQYGA